MPMPGKHDLTLYRGDTYTWRFRLWENTDHTIPYDLTDKTVAAEIRDKSGGAQIFTLTVEVDPDEDNVVVVRLPNTVRVSIPRGVWDLQISDAETTFTVLSGKVTVTGDVVGSTP